jgi:hypothetical protein
MLCHFGLFGSTCLARHHNKIMFLSFLLKSIRNPREQTHGIMKTNFVAKVSTMDQRISVRDNHVLISTT